MAASPASQGVRPTVAELPKIESQRAKAEWPFDVGLIPLRDMLVDDTYQRPPHHDFIARTAQQFDATLVGTIDVSERKNGSYAILDGQQRYFVMLQVGKTACFAAIYRDMTIEDEAGFFFRKNRDRNAMKPYYSFRARRVAGDPVAQDIVKIVESEGFSLGPVSNEDDVIGAIRAVENVHAMTADHRSECLSPTLYTIREALKGRKASFDSWVIQGLGRLWQNYTDSEVDIQALTEGLSEIGAQGLIGQAREASRSQPNSSKGGVSMPYLIARKAGEAHNKALGANRKARLDLRRLG